MLCTSDSVHPFTSHLNCLLASSLTPSLIPSFIYPYNYFSIYTCHYISKHNKKPIPLKCVIYIKFVERTEREQVNKQKQGTVPNMQHSNSRTNCEKNKTSFLQHPQINHSSCTKQQQQQICTVCQVK